MYCALIVYPRSDERPFDFDYFLKHHRPLGLGLLKQHRGVVPERSEFMVPEPGSNSDVACAVTLYFSSRADLEAFATLGQVPEVRSALAADLANYAAHPPKVTLSQAFGYDTTRYAVLQLAS